jgi:Mg-chelatase subunit ChlD
MPEQIGIVVEPKTFEQLGLLVLDGSGSMTTAGSTNMSKADEVNVAVRDLIARLRESRYRENFLLGVITYDDQPKADRVPPTPVTQLDHTADYNPLTGHGGETAIGAALESAYRVAKKFLDGQAEAPRSVVIVVMSDGRNTTGPSPIQVADRIKADGARITICAAGYGKGTDLDEQTLKSIVSSPTGYKHTYNTEDLRQFFMASITQQRA